jgi:exodeoxyribonuclease-1
MSFVFYATRTSGKLASFDQILDFAAIRTDADFTELDRFETTSRLLPHIVASPEMVFSSRHDISTLNAQSRPSHYEMACQIYERLCAWSPSTFVGFDSLSSDEHFLRQCLYQTLHPPYLTSCNGNTRADVAKVIQAATLLAPNALTIPQAADGGFQIDLYAVATANGLQCRRIGTAIEAVEAIAGLARLLNEQAPDLWSTAMRFSKKAAVVDFIENEPVFSLLGYYYDKPRCWLVTLIGTNAAIPVERYLFNLQVDPGELRDLSDEVLATRVADMPKPVRLLKTNGAPILLPEYDAPADAAGKEFDSDELNRRVDILQNDQDCRERLIKAFTASQPPKTTSEHVEEQLYDDFIPDDDTPLMEQFHAAPWERRASIASQFDDVRLKRIAQRLMHFEKPEFLTPAKRKQLDNAIASRLLGSGADARWMTLPKAMDELDALIAAAAAEDHSFLHGHRTHCAARIQHAQSQLGA